MAFGIALAPLAAPVASGFSFGTFLTVASIGSTILGTYQRYQQSLVQSRNLRTAAAYDRQRVDIARKQEIIKANNAARKLASEKRASIGARGVAMATGSTLLDQQGVYEELEDALFWVNQGYSFELASIDSELEGALQEEAYKRGTTLVGGAAQVALTSAMGDFSGFGSSSNSGYVVPNTQTGATRSVPMSFRSGITRGTRFGGMVDYSKGFGV